MDPAPPEHYRSLFELNMSGIYRTTLAGRILECNESMARMFGYDSTQELLARSAQDLYFSQTDRRAFLDRLRRAKVLRNLHLVMRRKDGEAIHILENVGLVPDARGRRTIIQGTMVDITELKRVQDSLRESDRRHRRLAGELRRLASHLQTVREEERTRIARELHDEFGQLLTGLKLDLHWTQDRLGEAHPPLKERLDSMCDLVDRMIQSVKSICADLRPALLDDLGLVEAIEWQAREFERRSGIRVRVESDAGFPLLSGERATAVFRILQESLTNAARHSGARTVWIRLERSSRGIVLQVRDDGTGIRPRATTAARSLGLAGMQERVLPWNGRVKITGGAGRGTTVRLDLPLGASPGRSRT